MDLFFLLVLMLVLAPLAVLGGIVYFFFCLFSGILKAAGAVAGIVVAIVFCFVGIAAAVFLGLLCLPLLVLL